MLPVDGEAADSDGASVGWLVGDVVGCVACEEAVGADAADSLEEGTSCSDCAEESGDVPDVAGVLAKVHPLSSAAPIIQDSRILPI